MSVPDEVPVSITEQRLGDAFAAAAQTVSPTTIRLPQPNEDSGPAWGRRRMRNRPRSWERRLWLPRLYEQVLIPLAAAAAAALVATALNMVAPKVLSAPHGSHRPVTEHVPAAASEVRAKEIAAGYTGGHLPSGATPRYFVGIRPLPVTSAVLATSLTVYSTATGRVVGSLEQPGQGRYYRAVAALGSNQTFVAAAISAQGADCHTWFYRFNVGRQGQPTRAQLLSVPEVTGEVIDNSKLAVSADGGVLAYSAAPCSKKATGQVGVIRLGTRKITTWSTVRAAAPRNLSLSANGTLLSFVGSASSGRGLQAQSADVVWTLATNAPSGPVASHYHRTLYLTEGVQSAELSPTGVILFAMPAVAVRPAAMGRATVTGTPVASVRPAVNAYDTATGKLIGLVHSVPGGYPASLSPDVSGEYVLLYPLRSSSVQELNLVTRQLRTIPVAAADSPLAAAW